MVSGGKDVTSLKPVCKAKRTSSSFNLISCKARTQRVHFSRLVIISELSKIVKMRPMVVFISSQLSEKVLDKFPNGSLVLPVNVEEHPRFRR
jgi:hypothetical protein